MAKTKATMAAQVKDLSHISQEGEVSLCHPVQVFLLGLGVASYWADVGFDTHGMIRWLTMAGCYR